jgi:hypothetical protein
MENWVGRESWIQRERRLIAEEVMASYGTNREGRAAVRQYPQPTTDSLDPLNWSKWRKHTILAIVMWMEDF